MPVSEAIGWASVADLARLGTVVMWAVCLFLLKDLYREYRELHGKVNRQGERIARLEGIAEES